MQVISFQGGREFLERAGALLLEREAENNLMLGVAASMDRSAPPLGTKLYAVEDAGRAVAAGMMTPRHPPVITRGPEAAIRLLAERVWADGVRPAGVTGPRESAEGFARRWTELSGKRYAVERDWGIYQADSIVPPAKAGGELRRATAADVDLLAAWSAEFCRETNLPAEGDQRAVIERQIKEERLFVWCDPAPVSAAAWAGKTPNGVRINSVYTPPEQRRRGYASAGVAALSSRLLTSGRKFCFLFTDLANPTSNKIYQAIGYRHVCDFQQYVFDREETTGKNR